MSIAKIEPTTKVKEWVNRINRSFDEIRKREYRWTAVSVVGKETYDFAVSAGDKETTLKRFDAGSQYTVQYGGVILEPEDYKLEGTTLTFVNGPTMEEGYAIIVRYAGQECIEIEGTPVDDSTDTEEEG